ncbi:MAG: hypothetical protein KGH65_03190 [Candidatus Micrarchaeota archaeon]|nr:hypothetical protein [Candidatus Micrarchaeota archaeon]
MTKNKILRNSGIVELERFIISLDFRFQGKLEFAVIKRPDGTDGRISKKYDKNSFELGFYDYKKFLSALSGSGFLSTAKRYDPELQFGFLQFLSTPDLEHEGGLKNSLQRMNQILDNLAQSVKCADLNEEVKIDFAENLAYVAFNFSWQIAREVAENLLSDKSILLINRDAENIPLSEYSRSVADVAFKTAMRNTVRNGTELL